MGRRPVCPGSAHGEREQCRINLRNFALAVVGYQYANGSFPQGTLAGSTLPPEQRVSWVPLILSWTDYYQGILYLFERDRPWDAPENRLPRIQIDPAGGTVSIMPSTSPPWFPLRCPSNHSKVGPGMPEPLHYVGIAGLGTDAPSLPAGHPRRGVRLRSSDAAGRHHRRGLDDDDAGRDDDGERTLDGGRAGDGPWPGPGPAALYRPGRAIRRAHPGGAMVAFADGSVRFLIETIDPKVFEAISTIAGGEGLPQGWDR